MVLLFALSPWAPSFFEALPRCGWKAMAGLPCPACGSSRAALALASGDVVAALAVNPLAAVVLALLLVGGLIAGVLATLGRRVPEPPKRIPPWGYWGLGLAVLLNWVYLMAHGR